MNRTSSTKHQAPSTALGFTLIELTIVLAIIASVMGGMIALTSAALEGRTYNNTAAKLKILQQALADYRLAYNRLPCPADSTQATSSTTFGLETAGGPVGANCLGSAADAKIVSEAVGMVPVRTLGLPDEMAIDSWGRRIHYAVASDYATADSFSSLPITNATVRMTVLSNDSGLTQTVSDKAIFVLVSHGADGHGGYIGALNGLASTRFSAGITNQGALYNCKCTSGGAADNTALATFAQGDPKPDPTNPLNNFDDIVVFGTRADLRGANE